MNFTLWMVFLPHGVSVSVKIWSRSRTATHGTCVHVWEPVVHAVSCRLCAPSQDEEMEPFGQPDRQVRKKAGSPMPPRWGEVGLSVQRWHAHLALSLGKAGREDLARGGGGVRRDAMTPPAIGSRVMCTHVGCGPWNLALTFRVPQIWLRLPFLSSQQMSLVTSANPEPYKERNPEKHKSGWAKSMHHSC